MKKSQTQNLKSKILNLKSKINIHYLHLLIIIVVSLAIYTQSVKFDFIYFDENTILLQNQSFFTTHFSLKNIFTTDAFIHSESAFYRPLQNLSFSFDAYIAGGFFPWMYHLSNIILFILISISLYFFLLKLDISPQYAVFGALLFITNPLNVWSAVWIPSRGDLLLTLFTLLSFICFINFMRSNCFITMILTSVCFLFAIFSKETAAFIPILFLFYFICVNGRGNLRTFLSKINFKHIILAAAVLCTGIIWYYLRNNAIMHYDKIITPSDFAYNLLNIPVALSQIVCPYEMSPFPKFSYPKIITGTIILMVLLFIVVVKTECSRQEKLFLISWFLLFLFPTFFIKVKDIDYFEHRFLLPQIGILALLLKIVFLSNLKSKIPNLKSKIPNLKSNHLFMLILIFFSITSFIKARSLQNIFTVVDAVNKYNGLCVNPYTNRGSYFVDNEMYEEAIRDFSKVLKIDPKNIIALNNLGKINMIYKEYENAIALYNISLSINNRIDGAYYNRSLAKTFLGDFDGALRDIDSAILLNNYTALLYNNRGVLKMNMGYSAEALSDFDEAVRLSKSTYTEAFGNRAFVKFSSGDLAGALRDCDSALLLEPENFELQTLQDSIKNYQINIY